MTSTFFGLETASRALRAQQTAMEVTAHNVANANTPGYSRQSAELATMDPYTLPGFNRPSTAGQVGTGAVVEHITRARDTFVDGQYRTESGLLGDAQVARDALAGLESVLNDPSPSGVSRLFGDFFNAWQDLANDPSDTTARIPVLLRAADLAAGFNRASRAFTTLQTQMNDQMAVRVGEINSQATEIAELNGKIRQVEAVGQQANDLRDRRDLLVDQIAKLVQTSTTENADGTINLYIGTRSLVSGGTVDALTTTPTGPGGMWDVRFSSDNTLVSSTTGELHGLQAVRDVRIPGYLASLDQVASDLISSVNALHTTGYGQDNVTGRPFFAGADAATIAVDAAMAADPALIGAADAPNEPGNNAVGLAIAQLRHTMAPTVEEAYGALVTTLGIDAQTTRSATTNESALLAALGRRREAVSGVALDEEAVNLVRYQRAFEAAARVVTTMDQMLDQLINNTGVVGR